MTIDRLPALLFGSSATQIVLLGGLVMARATPMLFLNPLFGGNKVPAPIKLGLSLGLALFVVPQIIDGAPRLQQGLAYWLLFGKESLIGFAIGFAVLALFEGVASAGRFIDIQRGANFADVLTFQTGERETHVGQLYMLLAQGVFLLTGGHLWLLGTLCGSFSAIPPWAGVSIDHLQGAAGSLSVAGEFIQLSARILMIVVQLSAPPLLTLVLVDFGGGIVNRIAPNVSVTAELAPAKLLIGLAVVWLMLPFSARLMREHWNATATSIVSILQLLTS